MNYPEIRFRDPFLLIGTIYNDIESAYMPPVAATDERSKLSRSEITEKLEQYEAAWRPYEKRLIEGMCALFNLEFRQNVIDIYAAPFYTSFSSPLFIATKYDPGRAVEVIAHELIHVLLYDNTSSSVDSFSETERKWRQLFGDGLDDVALIHVPVHAALQALFDDVLAEPARTLQDKEKCSSHPPYKAAWDYVEKVGYKKILEMLV